MKGRSGSRSHSRKTDKKSGSRSKSSKKKEREGKKGKGRKRSPVSQIPINVNGSEDEHHENSNSKGKKKVKEVNGLEFYTVEEILDKKKIGDRYFYKIKWMGWTMDQCTWEPRQHLTSCEWMVKEFNRKQREKSVSTSSVSSSPSERSASSSPSPSSSRSHSPSPKKDKHRSHKSPMEIERRGSGSKDHKEKKHKKAKKSKKQEKPEKKTSVTLVEDRADTNKRPKSSPRESGNVATRSSKRKLPAEFDSPRENIFNEQGEFSKGDIPESVKYSHHAEGTDSNLLFFIVKWKPRHSGVVPKESTYNNRELKELFPRALVEFYEERLRFVSKKDRNSQPTSSQAHLAGTLPSEKKVSPVANSEENQESIRPNDGTLKRSI